MIIKKIEDEKDDIDEEKSDENLKPCLSIRFWKFFQRLPKIY